MIRINQLKLNIAHTQSDLERKILKTLHMKKEYLQGYKIRRSPLTHVKSQIFIMFIPWMSW